ncbi:MAG: hypothetical protein H7343_20320 [Undibacterium sp.]|nr:hypothetical protein [Opitutaceae bacterium]
MRTNGANIEAALKWATEARNRSTRGSRITAWEVAVFSPLRIDGAASIAEAASARSIPLATLYHDLNWLRIHFGLSFRANETCLLPDGLGTNSPLENEES